MFGNPEYSKYVVAVSPSPGVSSYWVKYFLFYISLTMLYALELKPPWLVADILHTEDIIVDQTKIYT